VDAAPRRPGGETIARINADIPDARGSSYRWMVPRRPGGGGTRLSRHHRKHASCALCKAPHERRRSIPGIANVRTGCGTGGTGSGVHPHCFGRLRLQALLQKHRLGSLQAECAPIKCRDYQRHAGFGTLGISGSHAGRSSGALLDAARSAAPWRGHNARRSVGADLTLTFCLQPQIDQAADGFGHIGDWLLLGAPFLNSVDCTLIECNEFPHRVKLWSGHFHLEIYHI
jgi:hypothetical protein